MRSTFLSIFVLLPVNLWAEPAKYFCGDVWQSNDAYYFDSVRLGRSMVIPTHESVEPALPTETEGTVCRCFYGRRVLFTAEQRDHAMFVYKAEKPEGSQRTSIEAKCKRGAVE
jgi:hypothetical protein